MRDLEEMFWVRESWKASDVASGAAELKTVRRSKFRKKK
jgi:hypothetical protein